MTGGKLERCAFRDFGDAFDMDADMSNLGGVMPASDNACDECPKEYPVEKGKGSE